MSYAPLPIPRKIPLLGLYVGTSGYSYPAWNGRFYPPRSWSGLAPDAPERHPLVFYQQYFSFLEITNTFYEQPTAQFFLGLERRSKPTTMYSVKVYKDISNTRDFNTQKGIEIMRAQVAAAAPLIESGRFFSFLIQVQGDVIRRQNILDYLLSVAQVATEKRADVHIEFRHNSWHYEYVLQSMKNAGIGICNTEIPPVPQAFPLKYYATTPKGYVRFNGLNVAGWTAEGGNPIENLQQTSARYDYSYGPEELKERAEGILRLQKKTDSMAAVFNNHYHASAPLNAIEMVKVLAA